MESPRSYRFYSLILITFLISLAACSSSDDPTTPGENPPESTDTIAPVVMEFDPGSGTINIPVDGSINIEFSEPMLESTATGNITLSTGTVATMVWNETDTSLEITATGWSEGEAITLTVGTGLTDLAENPLPQAFNTHFFTHSSVPLMLELDLHGDSASVPRNVNPTMRFSEAMDLQSVYDATTISDGSKTVPEFQIGNVRGDYSHVMIRFLTPLDPETTYTVEISTDALTGGGTNLSAPVNFSFTTSLETDTTAPTLVSSVPAQGSVASRNIDRVVLNFSEPLDTARVEPDTLSILFYLFAQAEPVWNDAGDQMTIYLNGPLPAGVDLFMDFGDNNFNDWARNPNTELTTVRFTIEGEPDNFPVRDDMGFIFEFNEEGSDSGGDWNDGGLFVAKYEDPAGSNFDRLTYLRRDGEFTDLDEHWFMSEDDSGNITFRGYQEDDGNVMFNPAVNYLPNPIPATWSGSSQMTMGSQTAWIHFSGEWVEDLGDVRWTYEKGSWLIMENVVEIRLTHVISSDEAGDNVLSEGIENFMVCPGLGLVGWQSEEFEYEEGVLEAEIIIEGYLVGAGPIGMFK